MFETKLDAMVREKVERIVNAMPDASDRRDHRGRQIRAHRRAEGVQGWPLRTQAHSQGRQTRGQGAETEGRGLRVRGDRTLPAARAERRGVPDRHVPGRCVHPAGRRHQPIAVGRPHVLADALRQAQEGVRRDRRMAQPPIGVGVPIRVHGRRVAQTLMGRLDREPRHTGRHRHRPRGHRRDGGHEGGQGQLGSDSSGT